MNPFDQLLPESLILTNFSVLFRVHGPHLPVLESLGRHVSEGMDPGVYGLRRAMKAPASLRSTTWVF